MRGQPSGEFISVSGIGQDTRGYAAYFNTQTVSIRYPEFLKGYPLEGYRYPEDIQLVAVTLSTRWKKMKLHAYESGSTTDSRPTTDYRQPRLSNEQHSRARPDPLYLPGTAGIFPDEPPNVTNFIANYKHINAANKVANCRTRSMFVPNYSVTVCVLLLSY